MSDGGRERSATNALAAADGVVHVVVRVGDGRAAAAGAEFGVREGVVDDATVGWEGAQQAVGCPSQSVVGEIRLGIAVRG